MNKIKKTIALIICLMMAMGSFAFAQEAQLISVQAKDYEGHWAEATIEKWINSGKVSGYPDGSYKPDNNVTRAEFVKMVNGIINYDGKADIIFQDVNSTDWYYDYVRVAQAVGYISGYSAGEFGPNDYITREQAASILSRIQYLSGNATGIEKFNDNDDVSSWAKESVGAASEAGFIAGYQGNLFKPLNNLTRAEALTMLDNVLENAKNIVIYNNGSELNDTIVEGDLIIANTVGEGDVHLTNVEVKGDIKVYGGGINSLYFNNVKVSKIIVEKDKVRLIFDDGSEVNEITVSNETILVNENGEIAKITVTGNGDVTLSGNFAEVTVAGNANIKLNDAVIAKLVVNSPIEILGEGTIKALEANADDIEYEGKVKVDKVTLGEGVTKEPAVIKEETSGGGGGPSGPGGSDPVSYKISISAVIDGTPYNPLLTTSNCTGTENISAFLRDQIVGILSTGNSNISGYFTKLNNKIGNLKISDVQVNTADGLVKIKEELAGTSIVSGFANNMFDDNKMSESELKTILNAYKTSDLNKLDSIDLEKTLVYGDNEITPTFKFNGEPKSRAELKNIMITAAGKTINQFFTDNGTTVTIESTSTIGGVDKVTSFTIKKID